MSLGGRAREVRVALSGPWGGMADSRRRRWGAGAPLVALAILAVSPASADREADLAAVVDGVAARSAQQVDRHYTNPFPALAPDPASPALGNAAWALAALWKNVDLPAANQRLVEVRDGDFPDVYWAMGPLVRTHALFHCDSTFLPGRLTAEAEEALREVLREHVDLYSRHADASSPDAWTIDDSENHDVMRRSVNLLGCAFLAADPAQAARPMPDGRSLAEHRDAWSAWFVTYLQERARKGTFVERGSPTYAKYTIQSLFNLRDFAPSQDVRDLAGGLLDVVFADMAHEVFDGVRGGAKSRCYHDDASARGTSDGMRPWLYILLGTPASFPLTAHPTSLAAATSTYRIPRVVMDVALHPDDKGRYSYVSTGPARGTRETFPAPGSTFWYHPEFPSDLLRTTLASPGWIAGVHAVDPRARYMEIQSQNRWFGVIFRGGPDTRVFAQCVPLESGNRTAYDEMTGLAEGDAMVLQRLSRTSGGAMRIYFSNDLVREEAGGWVFARDAAGPGFIAVRPARGAYAWDPPEADFPLGTWMRPDDQDSPIVVQLGLATDFGGDLAAFEAAVMSSPPQWISATELEVRPLNGRTVTWFTDDRLPQVSGVTVSLDPAKAYDSPFIDWPMDALSGTVTSTAGYGSRRLTIDLARPPAGPVPLVLEAESGEVSPPMIVETDPAASGMAFVHVPDTPGSSGGEIRFDVDISAAASWTLWARMLAGDGGSNSFTESVDGDGPLVLGNGPAAGAWQWVRGATRALAAGPHEVVIFNREDGSRIDQVVLVPESGDTPPNTVARAPVDTDGDGVPDAWSQVRYGHARGEAVDLSRGADDPDGDEEGNAAEYLAGSDPADALDYLLLRVRKSGPEVLLAFEARDASAGSTCPRLVRHLTAESSAAPTGPWVAVAGLEDVVAAGQAVEGPSGGAPALEFFRVVADIR